MVAIDDIKGRDSFEAWLRETDQPREVCVALAARAALRVLPRFWNSAAASGRVSSLPVLRANLVASVAGLAPTEVMTDRGQTSVLRTAAQAAYSAAPGYAAATASTYAAGAAGANIRSAAAAAVSFAAAANAAAADDAAYVNVPDDARGSEAADAYAAAAADAAADAAWAALRSDCERIAAGGDLRSAPLFPGPAPAWFERNAGELPATSDWSFWRDWFERATEGRPQNWPLLLEIAIQEDAFWQGADADINARIATIVERHASPEPTDRLPINPESIKEAVRRTECGEEVFVNNEDVLDTRPVTDLTEAEFAEMVRRLRDVVALLQNLSTRTDAYNVLSFRLENIRLVLNRRSISPGEVHDVCRRTMRFVSRSIDRDDLPRNDPNLEDFHAVLDDTEIELSQRDGAVRQRLRLLTDARFERLTDEQAADLKVQTQVLAEVSTPELAEAQRQDIETASDDRVDRQDQKEARYRWTSRFVRMYEQAQKHAARLGLTPERVNAITATAERVIRWLLSGGDAT